MSSQLTISFEIICLMEWLLNHKKEALAQLVKDAVASGVGNEIGSVRDLDSMDMTEHLYDTVFDFVVGLEDLLIVELETEVAGKRMREKMAPIIKKIDFAKIDLKTLIVSVQEAKAALLKKSDDERKMLPATAEINNELFSQLLKNWHPESSEPMN